MVIYEVNLRVDAGVATSFERWLADHVQEMLEIDGFFRARWYVRDPDAAPDAPSEDVVLWTVQYDVYSREALDRYFREDAARMRADGLERFPGAFSATRRILTPRSLSAAPGDTDEA